MVCFWEFIIRSMKTRELVINERGRVVRATGGGVAGGGTVVGSGAVPHGPEVMLRSSRATSFLMPPLFRASNMI